MGKTQKIALVIGPALFVTELTSNTAITITMLPVASPNAIVYASGRVKLPKMFTTGIWMNLMGVLLVTLLACTLVRWVFG